jgi:hypothetical protein
VLGHTQEQPIIKESNDWTDDPAEISNPLEVFGDRLRLQTPRKQGDGTGLEDNPASESRGVVEIVLVSTCKRG